MLGWSRWSGLSKHGHIASHLPGTLPRTAAAAFKNGKPWVLDPAGIGIGQLRTDLLQELKQYKPAIVRGNASEIIALASLWGIEANARESSRPRGVDTTDTVEAARDAAVAPRLVSQGALLRFLEKKIW